MHPTIQKQKLFEWCEAELRRRKAWNEAQAAKEILDTATANAAHARKECSDPVPPGIYAFKELGRTALVITPDGCWHLMQILE